jgi:hypothetical protein
MSSVAPAVLLLAALSGVSCDSGTATAPSRVYTPSPPTNTPTPEDPTPGDFSQLAGTWNGDSRLTEVDAYGGTGCVPEEMRSQIGVSRPFTLSISDAGFVKLTDLSMNFSLWHSATTTDGISFTPKGYYWSDILVFRCSNGTEHRLVSACGGGIVGRLSGTEISGIWADCLEDLADESVVQLTVTFTGRR